MTIVTVDVDVSMDDYSDEDLIDELERRGKYSPTMGDSDELIDKIFHLRRQGRDFEKELDLLLYNMTGRAI